MNRPTSNDAPAVVNDYIVHVHEVGAGEWAVWLNSYDMGLCVGAGTTRDEAVAKAVTTLEAVVEFLQGPPPVKESER